MASHGEVFTRGQLLPAQSEGVRRKAALLQGFDPSSPHVPNGRFGRIFYGLPSYEPSNAAIAVLSDLMKEEDEGTDSDIPLAFAFLGQFIDHDITFDPISRLDERLDPSAVRNFRTPSLDLDNIYGEGPDASRHLYDTRGENMATEHRLPFRLLTGDAAHPLDLPRNAQGTAIIGDPRNDENLFISQIHAGFLRFHNAVVKQILETAGDNPPSSKDLFENARKIVVTHFHWIVVNEFLPHIVGQDVVNDIMINGRNFYRWDDKPFIPVEFGGAAYRMGHTLIRNSYKLNDATADTPVKLFDLPFFGLEKPSSPPGADPEPVSGGYNISNALDFAYFVDLDEPTKLQFCRKIDAKVVSSLFTLPFIHQRQDAPASLPERNMRRGRTLKLPSGQNVATAMGIPPLTNADLGIENIEGLAGQAPLWFYILKESELSGTGRLGNVGGRIVAETLLGLIEFVQQSYQHDFQWDDLKPSLPSLGQTFSLADLLTFGE